ncbi:MAG: hypothetical protein ACREML_01420 [Vulcanimicrobiaceae bacterium]
MRSRSKIASMSGVSAESLASAQAYAAILRKPTGVRVRELPITPDKLLM